MAGLEFVVMANKVKDARLQLLQRIAEERDLDDRKRHPYLFSGKKYS